MYYGAAIMPDVTTGRLQPRALLRTSLIYADLSRMFRFVFNSQTYKHIACMVHGKRVGWSVVLATHKHVHTVTEPGDAESVFLQRSLFTAL